MTLFTTTVFIAVSLKIFPPIKLTSVVSPRVIVSTTIPERSKAPYSNVLRLDGNLDMHTLLHPANALFPMFAKESGNAEMDKLEHSKKDIGATSSTTSNLIYSSSEQ